MKFYSLIFVILSLFFVSCDDDEANSCGDLIMQEGEECDGENLGTMTCERMGYPGGTLGCKSSCVFDVTFCEGALPDCGDGNIQINEECDGDNLGIMSCTSLGYDSGTLGCFDKCQYDITECDGILATCGDGIIQSGENCDGLNNNNFSCESLGFGGGVLYCNRCKLDLAACLEIPEGCGDGEINGGEECDGDDFGAATCEIFGLNAGTLTCSAICQLDNTSCASNWEIVSAKDFTCMLSKLGEVWCWGKGTEGQMGNGTVLSTESPAKVLMPLNKKLETISAKFSHVCGVAADKTVWCWGENNSGQLGIDTAGAVSIPSYVDFFYGQNITGAGAGADYSCVQQEAGLTYCMGSNINGKFGNGTEDGSYTPLLISATPFNNIAIGYNHTCGFDDENNPVCWGFGEFGQLGNGYLVSESLPVSVSIPVDVELQTISPGVNSTCALDITGKVWCWGENTNGELGTEDSSVLVSVPSQVLFGSEVNIVSISSGKKHVCALDDEGFVWCWGFNDTGQLGTVGGVIKSIPTPVEQNGLRFSFISCGFNHTCALDDNGDAWCWGSNEFGQLGTGDNISSDVPVKVIVY
jgi:alpha-tubulin suppressor-like RCC1 family protein